METPWYKRPTFYIGLGMVIAGGVLSGLGINPLGENLIANGVMLITIGHAIHSPWPTK